MTAAQLSAIDRHAGRAILVFNAMLNAARAGEFVDALKLQGALNEITRLSLACASKPSPRAKRSQSYRTSGK